MSSSARPGGADDDTAELAITANPREPLGSGQDAMATPEAALDVTPVAGVGRVGSPRRRWWWWVVASVATVVIAGVVYYGVSLYQVWSTGHSDQARRVDAIVVMGAANYNGRPSPLLRARLDHALIVYRAGDAGLVVLTGGKRPGDNFTEAATGQRYLAAHGVPAEAMAQESVSHTTWESLRGVAALLKARLAHPRILIVTDPFHALRCRLMAEELGLTAYTSPTRTSPWGSAVQFRRSVAEAVGVALGRVFGFGHLASLIG